MDEWTFQNAMSLSHDGTRLAFLVHTKPVQADSPIEIYIQDIDGSNTYALTSDNWIIQNPIWSPDDSQIVFLSKSGGTTSSASLRRILIHG
jgi:Tol biopolymer transport system component